MLANVPSRGARNSGCFSLYPVDPDDATIGSHHFDLFVSSGRLPWTSWAEIKTCKTAILLGMNMGLQMANLRHHLFRARLTHPWL